MKPFLEHAHGDDGKVTAVDWRSPDEAAMEHEEADDTDVDASRLNEIPPDGLLVLLRFLIPPLTDRNLRKRWRVAQLRLAVLAHAAGLPEVANHSLTELAEQLGVTRALMSLYAVRLVDELGQEQVRGGKKRASRETFRTSALKSHIRAGHKTPSLDCIED